MVQQPLSTDAYTGPTVLGNRIGRHRNTHEAELALLDLGAINIARGSIACLLRHHD